MNQISFLYTKLDDDDGISHYEVNFRVGTDEYEIDVHAENARSLRSAEKTSTIDWLICPPKNAAS